MRDRPWNAGPVSYREPGHGAKSQMNA